MTSQHRAARRHDQTVGRIQCVAPHRPKGSAVVRLDQHYVDPRLVAMYDENNPRGADTGFYLRLAMDLRARRILDLGCGTDLLTRELAIAGREVIGVDPAPMMLAYARRRPGADRVQWIEGDAGALGRAEADLVDHDRRRSPSFPGRRTLGRYPFPPARGTLRQRYVRVRESQSRCSSLGTMGPRDHVRASRVALRTDRVLAGCGRRGAWPDTLRGSQRVHDDRRGRDCE